MKIKSLQYLVFIVLAVTTLTACSPKPPVEERKPVDMAGWKNATSRLVQLAAKPDGSYGYFTSNLTTQPDLHSTWNALETRRSLNLPLTKSEKASLQTWLYGLLENGRFVTDEGYGDVIGELYYGLSIMQMAGIEIPQPVQIAAQVHAMQLPDGSYAFHKQDFEALASGEDISGSLFLTIFQALTVLELVGAPVQQQDDLIVWLNTQWERTWSGGEPEWWKVGLLLRIYSLIDPDNPRLSEKSGAIREWLEAIQDPAYPYGDLILLELNAAIGLAPYVGVGPDTWQPVHLLERLRADQNPDGGYNLFLDEESEWTGIRIAGEIFAWFDHPFDHAAMATLLALLQYEATAGYFPKTSVNSTPHSTWAALQTARLIGAELPGNEADTRRYVETVWNSSEDAQELYYAKRSAALLDLPLTISQNRQEQLLNRLSGLTIDDWDSFSTLYHTVLVLQMSGAAVPPDLTEQIVAELNRHRVPGKGYRFESQFELALTARTVLILHHLGASIPAEAVAALESAWNKEGHYSDRYPLLEQSCLVVSTLHTIGRELPAERDKMIAWIQSHFVAEGGAQMALGTDGDYNPGQLDSAAIALKTIHLLEQQGH